MGGGESRTFKNILVGMGTMLVIAMTTTVMTVGVRTRSWTDEWFFSRVKANMRLQLSALTECFVAVRKITHIRTFTWTTATVTHNRLTNYKTLFRHGNTQYHKVLMAEFTNSVLWYCWLGDRKGIHHVKKNLATAISIVSSKGDIRRTWPNLEWSPGKQCTSKKTKVAVVF